MIYSADSWYSPYTGQTGTGRELAAMAKTVTVEEKKIWLSRLRRGRYELEALEEARLDKWERATSSTASYSGSVVMGGGDFHKLDALPISGELISFRSQELKAIKGEILRAINSLPDQDQRSVLIHRYINIREWHEIAEALSFSERHVYRLHGEALKKIRISRSQIERSKKTAQHFSQ